MPYLKKKLKNALLWCVGSESPTAYGCTLIALIGQILLIIKKQPLWQKQSIYPRSLTYQN